MTDLSIEYLPTAHLVAYPGNARTHSPSQVRQITKSIKKFGFITPVLVDAQNQLIAGHGRLLAAERLGLTRVPVVRVDHLTEAQRRAYRLADNKLAENAGWDSELLRVELNFLMDTELDFDVDLIGFSTPEVDLLINPPKEEGEDEDIPKPPSDEQTVTRLGDIWTLGGHRIACGDARDVHMIANLLKDERARLVVTDPPYNVPISGHVSGLGKHQHDEFSMAAGEMTPEQFVEFLQQSINAMAAHCLEGALLYIFMDWRHLPELYTATSAAGLTPINLCVWVKSNGGMGSFYRSQHELVLVLKKGSAAHLNNVELGKHGRYRTNVWSYAGMNAFGQERDQALAAHPTVKPVSMIRDAIQDASHHGEIVLDYFLGSGTTLIAAEQCKRRCFGVEIDPRYVDVALQRWIALTGEQPVHAETGQTYERLRQSRVGS